MSRFRVSMGAARQAIVLVFAVVTLTTSVAAAAGSRPVLPRTAADNAAPVAAGPLDPLTAAEINETFKVIESYGKFPRGAFFPYVSLKEPTKRSVLDGTSSRKALAQVYDRKQNQLVEAVVDLAGHSIESWTLKPGAQPAVFTTDFVDSDRLVERTRAGRRRCATGASSPRTSTSTSGRRATAKPRRAARNAPAPGHRDSIAARCPIRTTARSRASS